MNKYPPFLATMDGRYVLHMKKDRSFIVYENNAYKASIKWNYGKYILIIKHPVNMSIQPMVESQLRIVFTKIMNEYIAYMKGESNYPRKVAINE